MRELADAKRIRRFMRALGEAAGGGASVYFTGGATAVLVGWRGTTVDVDLQLVPERDDVLRALPRIKDELRVNVELASPADFIPVPAGWENRSLFVATQGHLSFYHYDPCSQALAKLERGHGRDLADVRAMIDRGLVDARRILECYESIAPELYRFPAIDPTSFEARVREALDTGRGRGWLTGEEAE